MSITFQNQQPQYYAKEVARCWVVNRWWQTISHIY